MAHSYYATYHAIKGKTLVGGVKQGKTSRFGNRQDAELRLRTIIGLNNHGCKGEVRESDRHPEIFTHCGDIAQSIGGKCFRCGKVLTMEDACAACDNFEIGEKVLIEPKLKETGIVVYIMPEREQVIVDVNGTNITLDCSNVYSQKD